MTTFLLAGNYPGELNELDFPIDIYANNTLQCRWVSDLASGKHYSINGVKVVGPRQKGLGQPLQWHIFTSSYPSAVPRLNSLYQKVIAIEKILRDHGLAET